MIPKLPLAFLLLAIWIWVQSFGAFDKAIQEYSVRLESPAITLTTGTRGTWALDWTRWPEWRTRAMLAIARPPSGSDRAARPFEILARVEPRDSIAEGSAARMDAEGWFQVGAEWDWDSHVQLAARHPCAIEYRVSSAEPGEGRRTSLIVFEPRDEHMAEHARSSRSLATIVTFVPVLLCVLWFGLSWRKRVRAARSRPQA